MPKFSFSISSSLSLAKQPITKIMQLSEIRLPKPSHYSTYNAIKWTKDLLSSNTNILNNYELKNDLSPNDHNILSNIFKKFDEISTKIENLESDLDNNLKTLKRGGQAALTLIPSTYRIKRRFVNEVINPAITAFDNIKLEDKELARKCLQMRKNFINIETNLTEDINIVSNAYKQTL